MQLSPEDAQLFYRLHKALMLFVNQRLQLVELPPASTGEFPSFPPEKRIKVQEALLEHMHLIDAFVAENPFAFSADDLEIVRSWKDLVAGEFIVFRYLKKYTIFLTMKEPKIAYGVLALGDPFDVVIGPELPRMFKTTLLPFKGQIVYDGLLSGHALFFGSNYRRSFKESYEEAKKRFGIVTQLPFHPETARTTEKKTPKNRKRLSKAGSSIVGRWRITGMSNWDQDFVNAEGEAYFEFGRNGSGEFRFGHIQGDVDFQEGERNDRRAVEFSWGGNDMMMDPKHGRGWAVVDGDEIEGMIFIHGGDQSEFRAIRTEGAEPKKRKR